MYSLRRLTVIVVCHENTLEDRQYALSYLILPTIPTPLLLPTPPPPDEAPEKRQKFSVHAPSRRLPVCSTTALSAVLILMASKILSKIIATLDAANVLGCVQSRQLPVRSDMLSPFPLNLAIKKTCPPPPLSPSQTRMQMLSAEALRPPFCVLHKRHIPN